MSHSHEPIPVRVLAALRIRPMTLGQLATAVSASENYLRMVVYRMEKSGKVRRKGFDVIARRSGPTPYLWEAA